MATSITPVGRSRPPPIWPTCAGVEVEVLGEAGAPLVDELFAVDDHQRRHAVVGDHRAGHDGLAGARWGDEHAAVMADEIGDGGGLLGAQRTGERDLDRSRRSAGRRRCRGGCRARATSSSTCSVEPAGEVQPLEVLAVAADEPGRVPRREPHPLLLVELRVGDRPEMLQRCDHRRWQPGTLDRQHRPQPGPDHRWRRWPTGAARSAQRQRRARRRPGAATRPARVTASGAIRATEDRNAHWSGHGSIVVGSKNTVVPRSTHSPCSGRAIRFPNPAFGQEVLGREEPVVARQVQLGACGHRLAQQRRAHRPGLRRRRPGRRRTPRRAPRCPNVTVPAPPGHRWRGRRRGRRARRAPTSPCRSRTPAARTVARQQRIDPDRSPRRSGAPRRRRRSMAGSPWCTALRPATFVAGGQPDLPLDALSHRTA